MTISLRALQRRLDALSCPFAQEVTLEDFSALQKLTCWLEDTHIRRRKIPDRASLRTDRFLPALSEYLRELRAPFPAPTEIQNAADPVIWLVNIALQLHFEDNAKTYNTPSDPWDGRCIPIVENASEDEDIKNQVVQMLRSLGVELEPPSAADGMKVVAEILNAGLESTSADDAMDVDKKSDQKNILDNLPLGFSTSDPIVDSIAKIFRVLHVRDLRRLQTQINCVIAEMQSVTADPKTDSKLGRVGR